MKVPIDDRSDRPEPKFELHIEDRLDLIRAAPRDRALEILRLLQEAVYGEGFIRGVESVSTRSTALTASND